MLIDSSRQCVNGDLKIKSKTKVFVFSVSRMNTHDWKTNNMIRIKELTDDILEMLKDRKLKWLIVGLNFRIIF